jgi:ABC-2 type transport system ATP-binding protein
VTPLRMQGVVKRYGRVTALDGLSLSIPQGSVCALIGPNGSGKTTTFGVLASLLHTEAGTVDLFGAGPFDPARQGGRVSLMPQDSLPSPLASLHDSLVYYAQLSGYSQSEAASQASSWLERVGLSDRAKARIGQLSHGMRRRFSLAQALLGEPELILLDEPTSGLDPEVTVQMRELFVERRGRATVIVSSHILSELEQLCDYAVILERGRVVREGSMQLLTQSHTLVTFTLTHEPDLAGLRHLVQHARIEWQAPRLSIETPGTEPIPAINAVLLRALLDQRVGILELAAGQSLEATYLATRGKS